MKMVSPVAQIFVGDFSWVFRLVGKRALEGGGWWWSLGRDGLVRLVAELAGVWRVDRIGADGVRGLSANDEREGSGVTVASEGEGCEVGAARE